MATSPTSFQTLADLLESLGGVSAERVRWHPLPGTASEDDVLEVERRENRLCELIDGVLVEKVMGYRESILAFALARLLLNFVAPRNLGIVSGADGMMRLFPGLVRIPDVAYASWDRFPEGRVSEAPIPDLVPDLAIEVLSRGNTPGEMARKRRDYFSAGVRQVWLVQLEPRLVTLFTAPDESTLLDESEMLSGGDVLPGFALPLRELFSELDRQAGI